jgi:hypothetical protein
MHFGSNGAASKSNGALAQASGQNSEVRIQKPEVRIRIDGRARRAILNPKVFYVPNFHARTPNVSSMIC